LLIFSCRELIDIVSHVFRWFALPDNLVDLLIDMFLVRVVVDSFQFLLWSAVA
jgi:hypothetical protein